MLNRYNKYIGVPDDFLKIMLNSMPDFMKWYLSIFETVFMTGAFGLISVFSILTITNAITSFQNLASWIVPIIAIVGIALIILIPYKKTRLFSYIIQRWFYLKHNINELNIEMYYISKILEIRNRNSSESSLKSKQ